MREDIKERIEMIKRGKVPNGYKKTKVGIIPGNWKVEKICTCLSPIKNAVDVEGNKKYTQIGIRSHGKGLFYKEPISGKELGNKMVYWIEPNCFIVNIVFAWEQAIGKTTENEVGMIGSHRFPMYKPSDNTVLVDYLVYYFMTQKGKDVMEHASPGGAGRNRTLGQDRFMNSQIILPTINEQGKIVKILEVYYEKIKLIERLITEKAKQKKWFVQNYLTGKKRINGYELKWKEIKLGELFSERIETNDDRSELLSITGTGIIPRSEMEGKDNSSEDKSKYKKIYVGDIGYNTMRMWQGVSAYSNYEGIVSPAYTVLKSKQNTDAKFFSYLFKLPYVIFKFYRYSQGLVDDTRNLKYKNFKKIKLCVPTDIKEQKAIAQILSQADKEIQLLEKKLEQTKLEKKAMMQLLLTGIVRVNQ